MASDGDVIIERLASDFASVIPAVDAAAEHERFKPGIGPHKEEQQVDFVLDRLRERDEFYREVSTSVQYPDSRKLCDLVVPTDEGRFPVEIKLLRFRRDNGSEDPMRYTKVFSPFNVDNPTTLMSDSLKLRESGFERDGGLLGIYYEREDEQEFERMDVEAIAEKFSRDVGYWYDFDAELRAISRFDGLRHPVFQRGAVVTWKIVG